MHTEYKNVAQELLTVSVFGTTEVWCKADDPASVTILIASFHLVRPTVSVESVPSSQLWNSSSLKCTRCTIRKFHVTESTPWLVLTSSPLPEKEVANQTPFMLFYGLILQHSTEDWTRLPCPTGSVFLGKTISVFHLCGLRKLIICTV